VTKHSKFESERRAAETVRTKEIEAAWMASLPAEKAKAFRAAVDAARSRPPARRKLCGGQSARSLWLVVLDN